MSIEKKATEFPSKRRIALGEWIGLLGLGALTCYFVATSWLKWPDPTIDFGRELYIPWQLTKGAVLFRDAEDSYGPLSQYVNAALFKVFGPGLLVLVVADLLIFLAMLGVVYVFIRRAWGVVAALTSASILVAVFGFSQITLIGNYNYATPYSHEATHGLLISLILLWVMSRWVDDPTPCRSLLSGLLFGLTAVLKAEFMLASGLVICAAIGVRVLQKRQLSWHLLGLWASGAVLPTAFFWLYFSRYMPWRHSISLACRAWQNLYNSKGLASDIIQIRFLGFDQPWANLEEHLGCTFAAIGLLAALGGMAWLANRSSRAPARLALWALMLTSCAWLAWSAIDWDEIGRCILGLALIYLGFAGASVCRGARTPAKAAVDVQRLLFALLAAGLMARMALNGRIYQYGFYQAALATLLVASVLAAELPFRLGIDRTGRTLLVATYMLLMGIGALSIAEKSQRLLRLKTFPVGEGRDRFYAFPPNLEPTGEFVRLMSERLRHAPPDATLLVLPEGDMINYLARLRCPVPPFFFYAATTSDGKENGIVRQLDEHHPDYIVIISRDLREYGVTRYGERRGQGQQILEWVSAHYQRDWGIGEGDPLDSRQKGAAILSWRR